MLRNCIAAKQVAHVEITNLIIPGSNDNVELIQALIDWIAAHLGSDTPLHFSRYHPDYHHDAPATGSGILHQAYTLASQKLKYVYLGNLSARDQEATYCPACRKAVITRKGFYIESMALTPEGKCQACQAPVNLIN